MHLHFWLVKIMVNSDVKCVRFVLNGLKHSKQNNPVEMLSPGSEIKIGEYAFIFSCRHPVSSQLIFSILLHRYLPWGLERDWLVWGKSSGKMLKMKILLFFTLNFKALMVFFMLQCVVGKHRSVWSLVKPASPLL